MKILHITGEYPPFVLGGLGTYVEEVTSRLAKRNHQVDVCVISGDSKNYNKVKAVKKNGIRVFKKNFREKDFNSLPNGFVGSRDIIKKFRINDLVDSHFDIIHFHDWYGALWGAAISTVTSVPLVMSSHLPVRSGFTYAGHPIPINLKVKLESLGVRVADKIVAPSRFVEDTLIGEYNAEKKRISIIPNGVDFGFFNKPYKRSENKGPSLLSVSRLTEQKGIMYLLDVVGELIKSTPSLICTVVGDGPQKQQLIAESKKLNLEKNIKFSGFMEKEKIRDAYRESTMFISTSIYEPFGLVILEAMATGTPCVGFDTGGVGEIMGAGKGGIVVAPGDTHSMAESILKCIGDRGMLRKMSLAGIAKAKKYDWDSVVLSLELLYESIINDK